MRHPSPNHRRQRGFAMMALIALIALIGAYLIASRLSKTSTELSADRDQRTQAALREAKAALIAFAADRYKTQGASLKKLGALPCPDLKLPSAATAGSEEPNCTTVLTAIGRLPWKTLNVSSALRDGSGEQLWYVLSTNFNKQATVINSDTQGQITITGSAPASTVVALIIAPGLSLLGQNRDKTDLAALNDPSNYLEGANAGANDNSFETRVPPNDRTATGDLIFNDRVLAITQAELFAAVEPVVINKIRDADVSQPCCNVKAAIETYRATWGRYPFPAAYSDPCTSTASDCKGVVGLTEGWLPLTTDTTSFVNWKTSSPAPAVAAAPGNPGTVDVSNWYTDCGNSSLTQLECKFDWCGTSPNRARARITATANKAGLAFVRSFIISDLTVDRSFGGLNTNWQSSSATIVSSAYALDPSGNGNGTVSLDLEMEDRSCGTIRTARIRIPQLPFHSITIDTDPVSGWFVKQEWHKLTYYAVAPAWLPGGSGNCATSPPCLTVNGLPSNEYPPPINNKNAILILTGRSLNGWPRPAGLANYLEGQNAVTPPKYTFEHRAGDPGVNNSGVSINDRVVVLSP